MDAVSPIQYPRSPFNGAVEVGVRSLALLAEAFPAAYSLERLVIFDYLVVHSDDLVDGPPALHPRTPHRSGELLVRRKAVRAGLIFYGSRGLVEWRHGKSGITFCATETSGSFLDSLNGSYALTLRERAAWLVNRFVEMTDGDLAILVGSRLDRWGGEFELEPMLWLDREG